MDGTKSRQLKIALCGLTALGMSVATQGCSSSSNSGTGGATGSTGGSNGTAGHGTGGTTGTGGAGPDAGPACATVPAGQKIADFTADGGTASGLALGNLYASVDTGLTTPTFATSTGALVINYATGMPTTMYPYVAVGVPFAACANASASTGIKFNISGTLSPAGCTIQFSAIDKEHLTVANMGTCTAANCYPSSKGFTLPASATDVTILFTDQANGGMDTGAAALDPTKLTGIQWQVNPVGAMAGDAGMGCTGTITIDNVTFL
jgi:hypothetical protein